MPLELSEGSDSSGSFIQVNNTFGEPHFVYVLPMSSKTKSKPKGSESDSVKEPKPKSKSIPSSTLSKHDVERMEEIDKDKVVEMSSKSQNLVSLLGTKSS